MMSSWANVEPLIRIVYGVVILYFVLGGVGFYAINRNKSPETARKSYTKFFTYFIIVNFLFLCIVLKPEFFKYIAVLLTTIGMWELCRLFYLSGYEHKSFFVISIGLFILLGTGFYGFSRLPYHQILYTFLIVAIFDSFSQITGQLWGRKKILPSVSPHKTLGGVTGGIVIAFISSFLLSDLYEISIGVRVFLVVGIIGFAFAGDILASLYKRKYGVKDYSRLIPGHGGVLDRFDSLIVSGAWVAVYNLYI